MLTDVQASTKAVPPAAKPTPAEPAEEVEFAHVETCGDMLWLENAFFWSSLIGALEPNFVGTEASTAEAVDLSMQSAPPAPKDLMGSLLGVQGVHSLAKAVCRTQLLLLLAAPWLWRLGPAKDLHPNSTVASDAYAEGSAKSRAKGSGKRGRVL